MKRKFIWWVVSGLMAVSLILTSCAPAVTEEEKEEEKIEGPIPGYKYTADWPIILSLSDDRGNVMKKSRFNKWERPEYSSSETGTTLKVGDTITVKIEAWDSKGREIKYNWKSSSANFEKLVSYDETGARKWYTSNELTYTIRAEDLPSPGRGGIMRITGAIRAEGKGRFRFSQMRNDDEAYLDYTVMP